MPQVVNIPEVGQVRFPDEMTTDEITSVIQTQILPQFQKPVIQATPVEAPVTGISPQDLAVRVPAGISQATADSAAGVMQMAQDLYNAPSRVGIDLSRIGQSSALGDALGAIGTPEGTAAYRQYLSSRKAGNLQREAMQKSQPLGEYIEFAQDVSARSEDEYGVDPRRSQQIPSQIASGVGSLITAMGTGPLAPVTMAGMMGEAGRKEAEEAGATPQQQNTALYANAAVGVLSEALMGIPALLRAAKAARIPAETYKALVKNASKTAIISSGREATQEGLENTASNIVASEIAAYDPNRPVLQGTGTAMLVGGALGGPVGAVVQTAQDIDARNELPPAPDAPPDLNAVADAITDPEEDTGQPDLTGFGSAARESIPPPLPPSPSEQVSATVLGADPAELRQQEAIATGQPVPEINEGAQTSELAYGRALDPYDAFAGVQQAPESPSTPAVEAPLAPEEGQDTTQTPEGLVALDPDSFERLADQPVQEGFVAYQDEVTDAIFQVPANATPEQVQEAVVAARQENTEATYKLIEQQVAEETAILKGEKAQLEAVVAQKPREAVKPRTEPKKDFVTFHPDPDKETQAEIDRLEKEGWEKEVLPSGNIRLTSEEAVYRKDLLTGDAATKVWTDVDRLKFILDRMEMNLAKAKKGNLEDASGQPVMADELEAGVKKLRRRYNFLKKRVATAETALKGMNRAKPAPEGGAVGDQGGRRVSSKLSDIAPDGVLYRSEALNYEKPGIGAVFFSGDKSYVENYHGEGRNMRTVPLPERVLDIRDRADRQKMRKWVKSKIKEFESSEDFPFSASSFVRGAKKFVDGDTAQSMASAIANIGLAISKIEGHGLTPGIGEKRLMEALGVDAMTMAENFRNNEATDISVAFRENPGTPMKRASGEQGSTQIPQAIYELGQSLYRKGMAFADWSRAMVKHLGSQVRPFLADLWSSVVNGINSLSPAGRRFKRTGSVGRQSPQEVYDVFSDDLRRSKQDTQPNQDFSEADKQAVRDAYQELRAERGFDAVSIADVMERAGYPLTNQSKGLVMQMYRDGEITSLNMGDWSLSDSRKRAWGVRNNGDVFLTVTMPQQALKSAAYTDTTAFKEWFGDSKIVDANGDPLVMWHGSKDSFEAFNTKGVGWRGIGAYFGTEQEAKEFGKAQPFYLSVKNPFDGELADLMRKYGFESLDAATARRDLIKQGYDGIRHSNGTVAVFDPSQVRRANPSSGMARSAPSPEGGALGGQGGRRQPQQPAPPPLPTEEQRTFGVMNAKTDEARMKMGLPPAMAPARITFGQVWDQAMAIIAQNPDAGQELTTSLALQPRVITPVESAILTHESIRLDTAYERALDVVNQSATEGELEGNRNKMERIAEESQILFDVTRSVGTLAGQNLAARKLLVNQDLTIARMVKETRAAQNGQPLSEKQQKTIEDLHKKLKETETALKELQEKESKKEAESFFKALATEVKQDRKEAVKSGKNLTEFLNEQAQKARERIANRRAVTFADPLGIMTAADLLDRSIIGASYIANGFSKAADFAAKMIEDFGAEIEPYLPEILKQSQQFHDENAGAFNADTKTPPQPTPTEQTPQEILAEATSELDPRTVFELARAYVRSGMTKMDDVMERIHQDLLPTIPGLTVRDVRDAFSGYGKVTYPSKAEDLVKLREMKVLARLTSQLEDVLRRQAPLRTGPQRDKLTADARILQKQINDLMRRYNIRSVDPLQQLKTSREAMKTRLRNEIEELEQAINTRTRRTQGRTPVEQDAETQALQARRDKLRERYEELFPRAPLTPEQRIQQTLTALDKAIAEEAQMLKDGILKRPAKAPGATSTEIENKQMELDALRQMRRELYAATQPRRSAEDIALEQATKAAEASIQRMDEMLKSGNLSPAAKSRRFTPSQELEALWSERDAMREALHELRKAEKPRKDPEEVRRKATVKALEKSIAMLDERILKKDFSTTPQKANRPETQEVAKLREIRDQMRQTFNDLKRAATPHRSPEEIALERDKKNIRKRITQLQDKIAAGDYAPTPKKEPAMDREKRQLQYDYQKLRETYLKGVNEANMKAQGPVRKTLRVGAEVLNTSRAILTSMDFSGVLRQGGFIVFGNPVRALRSFPAMFKAFASEKGAFDVKEDIRQRDNYPLYQASKLYLADDAPASLNQMEEAFMSRWANRIPFVAGSQRAYVTFLNKLRADSFDAMVEGLAIGGKPTLEESRVIANFVNVATGRGNLGKMAGAGAAMNTVFFAPRYVLSRFQLLAGQPFYGGNARTRKAIAKEYTKYLLGVGSVIALLAAAGDDEERGKIFGLGVPIELDPVSSDFLKVRFGNTRLDPFSGLLQVTTVIERMRRRETKTGEGKLIPLSGETVRYGGSTTTDVMFRFIRSKFAPAVGSFVDWREEKNVVGEKVTPKDAIIHGLVPISFGEIMETMKEQGVARGTALSLLSMFGIGLQTYEPREKKSKSSPYSLKTDYSYKP